MKKAVFTLFAVALLATACSSEKSTSTETTKSVTESSSAVMSDSAGSLSGTTGTMSSDSTRRDSTR